MITFIHKGNFKKTDKFLDDIITRSRYKNLQRIAQKGVQALSSVTPTDTGLTAASWGVEITQTVSETTITWTNSNTTNGIPIVILLQYGHVTGTGGYVKGIDFINPAMRPIFDEILREVWKEVGNS